MTKKFSGADWMPATAVVVIGIAEFSHLCGVFLNRSFTFCALLFGGLAAAAVLLIAVLFLAAAVKKRRENGKQTGKRDTAASILLLLFVALVLSQLIFMLLYQPAFRTGDMTVETVGSFQQTNAIYSVNPMTGRAYEQGIPSRLKILCLPTLYGALCRLFSAAPGVLVRQIAPMLTLLGCYGAYASLAGSLFGEDTKKRRAFLIAVAMLVWAGSYLYGMDGFGLLYSGWRGVTIRNAVLIPWTVSLCLRKKWLMALTCVIAEACLVWTLYGMGACLFVLIGMAVIEFICHRTTIRRSRRKGAAQ